MDALLIAHLVIGGVGLLVMAFVAFPYRGRTVPKARRLTNAVAAVAEKVDPGESPIHGVLSSPEKSRQMSRRFEKAERKLRNGAKVLVPVGRHNS
ncbi:MAG: hypothetical protein ACXV3C_08775 [Actinomycetes bacterium]